MGTLGLVVEASVLREHDVVGFYTLATLAVVPSEVKIVVYLVRPKREDMEALADHVNLNKMEVKDQKREYSLFFVSKRSTICEKVLEEHDARTVFKIIGEYQLDLIPFDGDVLSMENESAFKELYIEEDPTVLHYVAKSVMKLQHLFGLIPNIKCKGDNAIEVARLLYRMRRELEVDLDSNSSEIDTLILIDRTSDLVTPWLTAHNYEGQLDDWLEIKNGAITVDSDVFDASENDNKTGTPQQPQPKQMKMALNSGDILFKEIRDMSMETLGLFLSKKAAYLREEYDKRHKAATVSELGEWVKNFKNQLQLEHALLQVHIALAEKIATTRRISSNYKHYRVEQAVVAGNFVNESLGINAEQYLEKLISKREPINRVLRLLVLVSIASGGLKSKRFDFYRTEILQTYGYEYIFTLNNLERLGAFKRDATSDSRLSISFFGSGGAEKSSPFSQIRTQLQLCSERMEDPLMQSYLGYCPISVRLVEAASRPFGWKTIDDSMHILRGLTVESKQDSIIGRDEENFLAACEASRAELRNPDRARPTFRAVENEVVSSNSQKVPVTLVFFIGGVTYGEISAIRALSKRDKNRDYVIATTKIVSATSLMDLCIEKIENNLVKK